MDEPWDRAKAEKYVAEIVKLEEERIKIAKIAQREAKRIAAEFSSQDKRLRKQIDKYSASLETWGIYTSDIDTDEKDTDTTVESWDTIVDELEGEGYRIDVEATLKDIEEADQEDDSDDEDSEGDEEE